MILCCIMVLNFRVSLLEEDCFWIWCRFCFRCWMLVRWWKGIEIWSSGEIKFLFFLGSSWKFFGCNFVDNYIVCVWWFENKCNSLIFFLVIVEFYLICFLFFIIFCNCCDKFFLFFLCFMVLFCCCCEERMCYNWCKFCGIWLLCDKFVKLLVKK